MREDSAHWRYTDLLAQILWNFSRLTRLCDKLAESCLHLDLDLVSLRVNFATQCELCNDCKWRFNILFLGTTGRHNKKTYCYASTNQIENMCLSVQKYSVVTSNSLFSSLNKPGVLLSKAKIYKYVIFLKSPIRLYHDHQSWIFFQDIHHLWYIGTCARWYLPLGVEIRQSHALV